MDVPIIAVVIYWGGEYDNSGDVVYVGGQKRVIWLNRNVKYQEFCNMVCAEISCDPLLVELKMVMRYPLNGQYMLVPLNNDNAMGGLWMTISRISAHAMEVYVDVIPMLSVVDNTPSSSVPMGSFTRMLCDPNFISDHITEFVVDELDNNDVANVDSDPEEDEEAREAADLAIMKGAPTQDWVRIDEVDQRKIDKWMTWENNITRIPNSDFVVGQEFDTLAQLKNEVKLWAIKNHHNFKVLESEPTKYVIRCVRNCGWRLRAMKTPISTFRITRYCGKHADTCVGEISSGADHPLITSEFVAELIEEFIRADPGFKVCSIVCFIKDKFTCIITYKRAWLAKQKALSKLFGDWEGSSSDVVLGHTLLDFSRRFNNTISTASSLPEPLRAPLYEQTMTDLGRLCIDAAKQCGQGHLFQPPPMTESQASSSSTPAFTPTTTATTEPSSCVVSPPLNLRTYRRRSIRTPSSLDVIQEGDTPSATTERQHRRTRGRMS